MKSTDQHPVLRTSGRHWLAILLTLPMALVLVVALTQGSDVFSQPDRLFAYLTVLLADCWLFYRMIYTGKTDGGCTLASVTRAGNTVRGRLNCTQPPGTADFETTIASPEHFTTRIHMRGAQGDMQADTDARWVAAQCAAPARPSPEAR